MNLIDANKFKDKFEACQKVNEAIVDGKDDVPEIPEWKDADKEAEKVKKDDAKEDKPNAEASVAEAK
jgi:hypothetical protein